MRLWHQVLLPFLDNKRLLSQHRECCALRGKGWGKKHATVDYVFKYDLGHLYIYHMIVMTEMSKRGYLADSDWFDRTYRGKHLQKSLLAEVGSYVAHIKDNVYSFFALDTVYKEHDDNYLKECLLNLKSKGAELVNGKTVDEMLIELDLKHAVE